MARLRKLHAFGLLDFALHPIVLVMLLIGAIWLRADLQSTREYQAALEINEAMREETNSSPFAVILGEARASMADLMWVKTERYMHRGVAYGAHLTTGDLTGENDHHDEELSAPEDHDEHVHDENCNHGEGEGEEDLATLIPEANDDYRGFIGRIHRGVQPWQDRDTPHEHTAGEQLLPWYRMLTLSDPHHWRGYMIGSWTLTTFKDSPNALDESEAFIDEGIRNNPDVFQLQLMKGRLRMAREDWDGAIEAFDKATRLGLESRPAQGTTSENWTDSDEEDFAMAVRYPIFLCLRKFNRTGEARIRLLHARNLLPADGPLRQIETELSNATLSSDLFGTASK